MTAIEQTVREPRALPEAVGVLLAVAACAALAWLAARVEPLGWPAEPAVEVALGGERYRVGQDELRWLGSFSALHFEAGEEAARALVEEAIGARLDAAFARARAELPAFADWYYSLRGEYSRLAMAALSLVDLGDPDYVANRAAEMLFPEAAWERDLGELERVAAARLAAHDARVRAGWLAAVTERLAAHRVPPPLPAAAGPGASPIELGRLLESLAAREQEAFRTRVSLSTLAAAGAAAGPAIWSAAAARRAAAGGRAAAARTLGRGAARAGSAAAGGAAFCAPSGPAALACALVAGTAVWLGTDWALLELDEHFNRDELIAALDSSLADLETQIEQTLLDAYERLIAERYGEVRAAIGRTFVPAAAGR